MEDKMPRAYLPKLAPTLKVQHFTLTPAQRQSIAATIPLKDLPPHIIELIEHAVGCFLATQAGSKTCTVANVLFVLAQLDKKGRACRDALIFLADDRAAVDYTTHDALQNLAKAALAKEPGADEKLLAAARRRAAELRQHPRIVPATEPLRFFCGILREIFNVAAADLKGRITPEQAWRRCRRFSYAVLKAADVEPHYFLAHRARLTEYLMTDITAG
jgi:hypothetical protein